MCWWSLRPDGLGNRLEQISNLLDNIDPFASTEANRLLTTLIWPVTRKGEDTYRGLSRWLRIDGAILIEDDSPAIVQQLMALQPQCDIQTELDANVTVMECNALRIHPNFNISFSGSLTERPVGVHIRTTDRISDEVQRQDNNHLASIDSSQTSAFESSLAIQLTTEALLDQKPKAVFIASDNPRIAKTLAKKLKRAGIQVVIPSINPPQVDPLLVDFFGLALCRQVWMVSSFSSFAILAARVGQARLYSLLPEEATLLYRYHLPDVQRIPDAPTLRTAKSHYQVAIPSSVVALRWMGLLTLFLLTVAVRMRKRTQLRPTTSGERW